MSYIYLQEQGEEFSAESFGEIGQYVLSRLMLTAEKSSCRDRGMESCHGFQSGTMSKPSTAGHGEVLQMLSREDSPVPTFPLLEKVQELTVKHPASGLKWPVSLMKYDREKCVWRTAQHSLFGGLDVYSETWPRWGTMRNGECWALSTPAHLIGGTESGLWATPAATDGTRGGTITENMTGQSLPQMVNTPKMWPTPKASAAGTDFAKLNRTAMGISLQTAVAMMPTPTSSMCTIQDFEQAKFHSSKRPPYAECYPTPCAQDAKNSTLPVSQRDRDSIPGYLLKNGEQPGGQLNPTWVEWLMGWPLGWTDFKPLAMDKFQQWRNSHGRF